MYLGIDIGSTSANAVLIDESCGILAFEITDSGYDHRETVLTLIHSVCNKTGILQKEIKRIAATGYGRYNVPFADKTVTEITCHGTGVFHLFPDAQLVIDIGGQDSKVIRMAKDGYVESFALNDKCSAGTGRFLEVMAGVMKMDIEAFSTSGLASKRPCKISSTCTVFAESEVISEIAKGRAKEDIIAGIYEAIVNRVLAMAGPVDTACKVILTGGVAKNKGIAASMKRRIPDLRIPFEPQLTGALGAALIAKGL